MPARLREIRRAFLVAVVRGILFLAPIVLLAILVREAVKLGTEALKPVAQYMPADSVLGIAIAPILAAVVLAALCFVVGIFAGTRLGSTISARLERLVLQRVPGFSLIKSMGQGLVGDHTADEVRTALAQIEECWVLAFVMERHDNGLNTVFVPSAPTPAAGAIYYLPDDRLQVLDVPVQAAMGCITRLGIGSRDLLARALAEKPVGPR